MTGEEGLKYYGAVPCTAIVGVGERSESIFIRLNLKASDCTAAMRLEEKLWSTSWGKKSEKCP